MTPDARPPARDAPRAAGGGETILVADDDDVVRDLLRAVLERRGYRVLEARDGLEALAIATRTPGPIDALVSDVSMPRMDGGELASHLVARRPNLRVLLITGFAAETALATAPRGLGIDAIEKPFDVGALADRLRALLDRRI